MSEPVQKIVIVGGGTAGWMTAAALSKALGAQCSIRLIESDEIGIVGVGEATIPQIKLYNKLLDLDENDFVRKTQGTFKLGVEFVNWGAIGDRYIHGFGSLGHDRGFVPFHHYWLKQFRRGKAAPLGAYSINTAAAQANKFMRTGDLGNSPLSNIAYAYQFDAGLYARYLRAYAEKRGVVRTEGKIVGVQQHGNNGFIDSVKLESGETVAGELFIDCSGFRGLLIEQTLKTGYEDWTHWLPCDRAMAVPCENVLPLTPYTRATARTAGWQWRIPLQHRMGNGHVYCSRFISDDEAAAMLLANLEGPTLGDPRPLRFVTGMRRKFWNRNVVAIGLSAGFMEPIESTSIHLIQSAIARLISFFPERDFDETLIARFNRQSAFEWERVRDFLVLHYHATERDDTPFWNYCRTMSVPASLQDNLDLFRQSGRFYRESDELFAVTSWVQVMIGQRVMPRAYHPLVDQLDDSELAGFVDGMQNLMQRCVDAMPTHAEFIAKNCAA